MLAFYGGTGIVWEAWGITFAIVFALTFIEKILRHAKIVMRAIFIFLKALNWASLKNINVKKQT